MSVSLITTIIYFAVIFVLRDLAGVDSTLTLTIAYVAGILSHFVGNKFFAFESTAIDPTPSEALKYAILMVINYFITLGCVLASERYLDSFYLGTLIAAPMTFVVSYPFMKFFVFGARNRAAAAGPAEAGERQRM